MEKFIIEKADFNNSTYHKVRYVEYKPTSTQFDVSCHPNLLFDTLEQITEFKYYFNKIESLAKLMLEDMGYKTKLPIGKFMRLSLQQIEVYSTGLFAFNPNDTPIERFTHYLIKRYTLKYDEAVKKNNEIYQSAQEGKITHVDWRLVEDYKYNIDYWELEAHTPPLNDILPQHPIEQLNASLGELKVILEKYGEQLKDSK